jgi:hypothetical protein
MLKHGSTFSKALFFAVATLTASLLYPGHGSPLPTRPAFSPAAYVTRGDKVERNFRAYNGSLGAYYSSLLNALNAKAPDLLPPIRAPKLFKSGYQVLPKLVQNPSAGTQPRDGSVSFSWPWTERMIEAERLHLIRSASELRNALSQKTASPRNYLEKLALDYQQLRAKAENIDEHIRYNRFWQAAIAADRSTYDHATALYAQVLDRELTRGELRYLDVGFTRASFARSQISALANALGVDARLRTREAVLTQRIDAALEPIRSPFVTLERRSSDWVFRVPMYTDIEDKDFVTSVKQAIESIWRVNDGARNYRVELSLSYLRPEALYGNSEFPAPGQAINLHQHLEKFPTDGAVLTTGASTTYVEGNAIILGPHAISPRVLAHEFGHVLGFRDRYVRGYRDLGTDGFEVLEVIADAGDIMAVPDSGAVGLRHFETLLSQLSESRTAAPISEEP